MINDLAYNHKEDGMETVIEGQFYSYGKLISISFPKTKAGEVIVMEKSGEEGPEGTVTGREAHLFTCLVGSMELLNSQMLLRVGVRPGRINQDLRPGKPLPRL